MENQKQEPLFRCIKTLKIDEVLYYKRGEIYRREYPSCITDEQGNKQHEMSAKTNSKFYDYFEKFYEPDYDDLNF